MRPQGHAQAGFYPLPPGAAKLALKYLKADDPQGVVALDPCVGDGVAFKILLDGLGIPYERCCAIELTKQRHEQSSALLSGCNVIHADAINGVTRPTRTFSFVYCNSPYSDEIGGGYRTETVFADRVADLLRIGGIALFVVPEKTWTERYGFQTTLAPKFVDISVVYPQPEDRPYDEVLVFAVRKDNLHKDLWGGAKVMMKEGYEPYEIPTLLHPCKSLKKNALTDEEVKLALLSSEIERNIDVPDQVSRGRPPLALGEGHNGMLVASGQAPPVVAPRDKLGRMLEIPHLVRGVSKKEMVALTDQWEEGETESGAPYTKEVYTEVFKLKMVILLQSGDVIELKPGSAEAEDAGPPPDKKVLHVLPGAATTRNGHGGIAV